MCACARVAGCLCVWGARLLSSSSPSPGAVRGLLELKHGPPQVRQAGVSPPTAGTRGGWGLHSQECSGPPRPDGSLLPCSRSPGWCSTSSTTSPPGGPPVLRDGSRSHGPSVAPVRGCGGDVPVPRPCALLSGAGALGLGPPGLACAYPLGFGPSRPAAPGPLSGSGSGLARFPWRPVVPTWWAGWLFVGRVVPVPRGLRASAHPHGGVTPSVRGLAPGLGTSLAIPLGSYSSVSTWSCGYAGLRGDAL